MERIAGPLMDKPTSRLTQADVLAVIKPVWETTNETARRVLGRIHKAASQFSIATRRYTPSSPSFLLREIIFTAFPNRASQR